MKRFLSVALAVASLAFGAAACKKAHDAGNDSMRAPGGGIAAAGTRPGNAQAGPVAGSPSTAASNAAASSGVSH
ncbi:hypothetical protein [Paraburkholderia diazotrophica]|uniref:Lipoprotein n=1 Tax=Paraburkholderia diazotrophica TaxID=667676 RepID=A0A1H7BN68_9BURK|nr:hypothetical protein [Paraburkholderia diazotrophica]SEJ74835.1 hypothetical protein SAMN05192539_101764 [Paraburkholderia diazotrophica]